MLDRNLLEGEIRAYFSIPDPDEEELRAILEHARPTDLGEILPIFETGQKVAIIRLLDEEAAGTVLDETDDESRLEIVRALGASEIADIVDEAPPDEAADILALLPEEKEERVLAEVEDREHVEDIRLLREYDEETAGGVMTTEFVTVPSDASVGDALQAVREASDVESVPYVYVLTDDGQIAGVTSLRELIESDPQTPVRGVMETDVVTIGAREDQEEASKLVDRYDLVGLPVVGDDRRMLGVVTFDDAMDVMDAEAEEDLYKIAGTGTLDRPLSAPVMRRVRVRLPWLIVTLVGASAAVVILFQFKETLEANWQLGLFMPVLAAMCGNISMQSSAMLIRGLATGEVDLSQTAPILLGELLVGTALGGLCGVLAGVLGALVSGRILFGVIVAISMALGMVVAIVVGTITPMLLERFKIDPAVASGPFVTTLNDITGLTTYAATAALLLEWFPR